MNAVAGKVEVIPAVTEAASLPAREVRNGDQQETAGSKRSDGRHQIPGHVVGVLERVPEDRSVVRPTLQGDVAERALAGVHAARPCRPAGGGRGLDARHTPPSLDQKAGQIAAAAPDVDSAARWKPSERAQRSRRERPATLVPPYPAGDCPGNRSERVVVRAVRGRVERGELRRRGEREGHPGTALPTAPHRHVAGIPVEAIVSAQRCVGLELPSARGATLLRRLHVRVHVA